MNERALIDTIQAAVVVHDAEAGILSCNRMAGEILGRTADELVGRDLRDPGWIFLDAQGSPLAPHDHPVNRVIVGRQPLRHQVLKVRRPPSQAGASATILLQAAPLLDGSAAVHQVVLTFMEIGAWDQAAPSLRSKEAIYSGLFHHSNDAIFIHDTCGGIIDVNRRAEALFGYSRTEMLGMRVAMLHPPGVMAQSKWAFETILSEGHVQFETEFVAKNGALFPAEVSSSTVTLGDQVIVQGIVRDLRDPKAAERARREAFEIIESSPICVFLWRNAPDWPVEFVTANVEGIFGYTAADFMAGRVLYSEVVHREDLPRVAREVAAGSRDPEQTTFSHDPYRIVTPSGTVRWIRDHTVIRRDAAGAITHYQGVVEDVSDRLAALRALNASEDKFAKSFQLSPDPLVITRVRDGRILNVNDSFVSITGHTREAVIGRTTVEELGLWDNPQDRSRYLTALRQHGTVHEMELAFRIRNGERRLGAVSGALLEIGDEPCILATIRDVTATRQAEDELRHLRNYLASIIDSMPSVLVGVNPRLRVTQWNREAQRVTGISHAEALGRPLATVFPRLRHDLERIEEAMHCGRVVSDPRRMWRSEGQTHYEEVTIFPLEGRALQGAVIRVDDVTERVRIEEMMIQNEKMVSMGGLAAGMAHEINNPLAGILQNATVLSNRLLADLAGNTEAANAAGLDLAALKRYLALRKLPGVIDNIRSSGERAAAIVSNMLTFARKSDGVAGDHDLCELLDQTLELVRTDYDLKRDYDFKRIRIVKRYDSRPQVIPCIASKLQQVFLNLLINGAEAMTEAAASRHDPTFTLRIRAAGEWVDVAVEDNGPGIEETLRHKVFEPFFTTKPVGKGTGLGLSVSYFIVTEDHGGEMRVEAGPDGGARFVVRLPAGGKASAGGIPAAGFRQARA